MSRIPLAMPLMWGLTISCQAPSPAPRAAPVLVEASGEALGTTWHVRWVGHSGAPSVAQVTETVSAVLGEVDQHMSTWRDDSELSLARRATGPVAVSEDTALVVDAALDLARVSGRAFDPTVQPLMELWGFFGARRDTLPSDDEVRAAMAQMGVDRVRLGRDPSGGPTLDAGGTALDLSAIAKGHAVDRVHNALSRQGLASLFVEVGGEVRVSGPALQRPLWRVGVDLPDPKATPGQDLALVVSLTNGAVATSGNYRNRYEVDGQMLVHTMDPRIGRPIQTAVASATVLAPDCRTADGVATTLMVLSPEDGLNLVERLPDVQAALLVVDGERFALRTSGGLADSLQVVSDRVEQGGQ